MIPEISYPAAVLAGALSFLSPCVLPLVPPYLCYMAGVSISDLRSGHTMAERLYTRLLGTSTVFVLGFSTVFVLLGAGAGVIGQALQQNFQWLGVIAGVVIIAMGLNFLGFLHLPFLSREGRFHPAGGRSSIGGAYLMGLAFAFGWTPCIGPVLGTILGVAGAQESGGEGARLLAFYSAGLGAPFILAAAFSGAFLRLMGRFRRHFALVERVLGGLLVIAGILFLTGGMQTMAFWLLDTFPLFQKIG
jgi:cytochrome c-type biogenesis protein